MNSGIKTAVILAAGLGSRLGELKNAKPKAFLEFDGIPLIERSILLLIEKGMTSIMIGTGYESKHFETLEERFPQVRTVKNENYATTGSMYTLNEVGKVLNEPFLLLEGDLLYEKMALDILLDEEHTDVILASDATNSGDEVFIETDGSGNLVNMSKEKSRLGIIAGELVGISKISLPAFNLMIGFALQQYNHGIYDMHYEDALVGISRKAELKVTVVNDLAWCEIDEPSHLERAKKIVYPKILARD